jgi:ketol-acid reductoisomerase
MVAPKGPGKALREEFLRGWSLLAQVAVHHDATGRALETSLAIAKGLGCTRAGVLVTTCAEEAEADLFGEQAVLCGGMMELVRAGFETLLEAGYSPEAAYIECCHELRFIVDLVQQAGLEGMFRRISPTAGYGALTRGRRVIGEPTRAAMREMLAEVRSGAFTREYLATDVRRALADAADREAEHPLEVVGRRLRREMGIQ